MCLEPLGAEQVVACTEMGTAWVGVQRSLGGWGALSLRSRQLMCSDQEPAVEAEQEQEIWASSVRWGAGDKHDGQA